MARDYKNKAGAKEKKTGAGADTFLSFFGGLSVGLLVAFAIFLYQYLAPAARQMAEADPMAATTSAASAPKAAEKAPVPAPTFDFYQILPNREVNLSEWVDETPQTTTPTAADKGLFILQVGSFKTFEAADQIKAELALLGINADIQRVVINGQDIRHRVRLGPYSDPAKLEAARQSLMAHKLDFMLLRLEGEEAPAGGG